MCCWTLLGSICIVDGRQHIALKIFYYSACSFSGGYDWTVIRKGTWINTAVLRWSIVMEAVIQDCTICRISSLLLCSSQFYKGYFNGWWNPRCAFLLQFHGKYLKLFLFLYNGKWHLSHPNAGKTWKTLWAELYSLDRNCLTALTLSKVNKSLSTTAFNFELISN